MIKRFSKDWYAALAYNALASVKNQIPLTAPAERWLKEAQQHDRMTDFEQFLEAEAKDVGWNADELAGVRAILGLPVKVL